MIEATLAERRYKLRPPNFLEFLKIKGEIASEGVNFFCILPQERTRYSSTWQYLVSNDALDLWIKKESQIGWFLWPLPGLLYSVSCLFLKDLKAIDFFSKVFLLLHVSVKQVYRTKICSTVTEK